MFITPLKMMRTYNHFSIFFHEPGVFLEHTCAANDKKKKKEKNITVLKIKLWNVRTEQYYMNEQNQIDVIQILRYFICSGSDES